MPIKRLVAPRSVIQQPSAASPRVIRQKRTTQVTEAIYKAKRPVPVAVLPVVAVKAAFPLTEEKPIAKAVEVTPTPVVVAVEAPASVEASAVHVEAPVEHVAEAVAPVTAPAGEAKKE